MPVAMGATRFTIWYLGEDSFERERGHFVKPSDSWRSGVGAAKPRIIQYYVAGVGEILERAVKGHHEEFRLVRITR
jgi:hypothetical protein